MAKTGRTLDSDLFNPVEGFIQWTQTGTLSPEQVAELMIVERMDPLLMFAYTRYIHAIDQLWDGVKANPNLSEEDTQQAIARTDKLLDRIAHGLTRHDRSSLEVMLEKDVIGSSRLLVRNHPVLFSPMLSPYIAAGILPQEIKLPMASALSQVNDEILLEGESAYVPLIATEDEGLTPGSRIHVVYRPLKAEGRANPIGALIFTRSKRFTPEQLYAFEVLANNIDTHLEAVADRLGFQISSRQTMVSVPATPQISMPDGERPAVVQALRPERPKRRLQLPAAERGPDYDTTLSEEGRMLINTVYQRTIVDTITPTIEWMAENNIQYAPMGMYFRHDPDIIARVQREAARFASSVAKELIHGTRRFMFHPRGNPYGQFVDKRYEVANPDTTDHAARLAQFMAGGKYLLEVLHRGFPALIGATENIGFEHVCRGLLKDKLFLAAFHPGTIVYRSAELANDTPGLGGTRNPYLSGEPQSRFLAGMLELEVETLEISYLVGMGLVDRESPGIVTGVSIEKRIIDRLTGWNGPRAIYLARHTWENLQGKNIGRNRLPEVDNTIPECFTLGKIPGNDLIRKAAYQALQNG